ncbi:hypothetical protein ACHAWF_010395 [Thalassiosira exigua]
MRFVSLLSITPLAVSSVVAFAPKASVLFDTDVSARASIGLLRVGAPAVTLGSSEMSDVPQPIDRRPHEQRVSGPRKARRLNHPFQHLQRHSDPWWDDNNWDDTVAVSSKVHDFYVDVLSGNSSMSDDHALSNQLLNSTFAQQPIDVRTSLLAMQYLHMHGGYTLEEIRGMSAKFPPLLEMDVLRHFRPKMRFLKECLGGATSDQLLNQQLRDALPPNFFGTRLERTIAPRHAFLVHIGLPSGKQLWDGTYETRRGSLLDDFLVMHRKPKQFASMCNNWRRQYGSMKLAGNLPIKPEQVIAFDKLFQRGILSAARDDSSYIHPDETGVNGKNIPGSPSLLKTANVTSAQLVRYLIQHGANPWETDVRGASLFHWASGCGNLDGLQALVEECDKLGSRLPSRGIANSTSPSTPGVHAALLWKASRDDAVPLHWAAAGAGPKEFGIGGHMSICNYLLSLCTGYSIVPERKLINSQTRDGNTILMWSAWSRSADIVKLLVRNRADTTKSNRNGCTVAHWAASGGDLSVCQYLHEMANVNFNVENSARNTPLSHSVAYGRYDVAKWLKEDLKVDDEGGNVEVLALDFVHWAEMGVGLINEEEEEERRGVYSLFNSFNDWKSEEMGEEEV